MEQMQNSFEAPEMQFATAPVSAAVTAAAQTAAPAYPDRSEAALMAFDERWQGFARVISHSRFLPPELRSTKEYDSTGDILMYLVTAHSLGLDPIASLFNKSLYIMPDARGGFSVSLWTSAKVALATKHGCRVHSYFDPKQAAGVCEVQRGNAVFKATYTAQEAVIAGKMYVENGQLHGYAKSSWEKYWPTMLIRRAQSRALEQAVPDILMGMASTEETRDWQEVTPPVPTAPEPPADIPVPAKLSTDNNEE